MSAPRIMHIITDLDGFGGTEATLLRYLKESRIPRNCHRVIVIKSVGIGDTLGAQMVAAGINVLALDQRHGFVSLSALVRLYRELRAFEPDVISGWLYHPSLLASMLKLLSRRELAVVWHIRSLPFASLFKTPGRMVVQRILAVFSRITNPIMVSNAVTAKIQHAAIGFRSDSRRWRIIPNGIDVFNYFPKREDGLSARSELNIPKDAILIGCVGRFVPEKGYPVLFEALSLAKKRLSPTISSRLHFLAIGNGVSIENESFKKLVPIGFPLERMRLLGKRADVARLLRALDIYILPSISEAFPNSLVEAMATGLPCIATDVGACSEVLSMPDFIVQPNDAVQLADRIITLVAMNEHERKDLGAINKQRIAAHFGLNKMVDSFDAVFNCVATTSGVVTASQKFD